MKNIIYLILIALAVVSLVAIIRVNVGVTCSNFNSQIEAQLLFDENPFRYRNLDRDADNIPCESLK